MKRIVETYDPQVQRILEMLPGMTAWLIILFPLWGAFFIPRIVAYFTIGFLVFWFYRSFQAAFLGFRGYRRIRRSEKVNWHQQYKKDKNKDSLRWEEVKHLIIIPNYNESVEKLSTTLDCLAKQKNINKDQLLVVLAMEERIPDAHQKAKKLVKKYKGKFGELIATFHPDGLPGEVRGKASNEAWGAKQAKKILIEKKGYDINKMTITSCLNDIIAFGNHPLFGTTITGEFQLLSELWEQWVISPIFPIA